jgi:hypothetical protein
MPGDAVTWVGDPLPAPDADLVTRGELGVFVDYDGADDSYVVRFPGGRIPCCTATDVQPVRTRPHWALPDSDARPPSTG